MQAVILCNAYYIRATYGVGHVHDNLRRLSNKEKVATLLPTDCFCQRPNAENISISPVHIPMRYPYQFRNNCIINWNN